MELHDLLSELSDHLKAWKEDPMLLDHDVDQLFMSEIFHYLEYKDHVFMSNDTLKKVKDDYHRSMEGYWY